MADHDQHDRHAFWRFFWQLAVASALLAAIITGSVMLFWDDIPKDRYSYDEADYRVAASKGFWSNYLDGASYVSVGSPNI